MSDQTVNRRCLTSGMQLSTNITPTEINIRIRMPHQTWNEATAEQIDNRLHDGIEYALAPFWFNACDQNFGPEQKGQVNVDGRHDD